MKVNPEALRSLRLALGWSTVRFAAAVGTKHAHISNVEAGRRNASPELITRMAEVLDVPRAALCSEHTPEEVAAS